MTLYVARSGRGEPAIVFVHGMACTHEDWKAQCEALAPLHEVLACDLPGHGRSTGALEDASIAAFAREVARILPRRAVVVGHSMSCRVALETARVRPERIAGLVLVDGSRVSAGDPARSVESVRRQIAASGYARFIEGFFGAASAQGPKGEAARARAARLPAEFGEALFLDVVRWDAVELDAALAAVKEPLLAIQSTSMSAERKRVRLRPGESSPWLELIRERVPGARLEVITGAGHFTHIDAPDRVSRLIGELAGRAAATP